MWCWGTFHWGWSRIFVRGVAGGEGGSWYLVASMGLEPHTKCRGYTLLQGCLKLVTKVVSYLSWLVKFLHASHTPLHHLPYYQTSSCATAQEPGLVNTYAPPLPLLQPLWFLNQCRGVWGHAGNFKKLVLWYHLCMVTSWGKRAAINILCQVAWHELHIVARHCVMFPILNLPPMSL